MLDCRHLSRPKYGPFNNRLISLKAFPFLAWNSRSRKKSLQPGIIPITLPSAQRRNLGLVAWAGFSSVQMGSRAAPGLISWSSSFFCARFPSETAMVEMQAKYLFLQQISEMKWKCDNGWSFQRCELV